MVLKRHHALVLLPGLMGIGFAVLVALERELYGRKLLGMKSLIAMEAVYLLIFLFAVFASIAFATRMLTRGHLLEALWIIISLAIGIYMLGMGLENGAAILHAT